MLERWLKKIGKKIVCRKVFFKKMSAEVHIKKSLQRKIFHTPLQENNGPSLKVHAMRVKTACSYADLDMGKNRKFDTPF